VRAARERVAASDVLIVVTPEFNGIPGVLKNAFDWLSRPAFRSPMAGKPVLFATHSPGALGGCGRSISCARTLCLDALPLDPLPEIAVTHIGGKVSEGRVCGEETLAFLDAQVKRFLWRFKSFRLRPEPRVRKYGPTGTGLRLPGPGRSR
jgi:chromate reductase